jgi:hypothetical protein
MKNKYTSALSNIQVVQGAFELLFPLAGDVGVYRDVVQKAARVK